MDFETRLAMEWEEEIRKYQLACQHLLKLFTLALNAWVKTALEQMPADWRASWDAFVQAWSAEGVELKDHWKRDFAAWLEFYEREAKKAQAQAKTKPPPSRSVATARREAPAHLPDPYDPIDARRFSKESLVAEVDWIRGVGPFAGLLRHLRSSRARQFVTIDDRHRLHLDGLRIIEREQARLVLTAGETKELDQYLTELMFTLDSPNWPPTVPESWSKKDRLAWQAERDSPPGQRSTERDKWSEVFRSTRLRAAEIRLANQLKVTPEWDGNQYLWVFFDDRGTFARIHVGDFRDGEIHIGEAFGGYVLRSDWWDARGEDVLRGEANLFVRYVLEPTEGPIRRDELFDLVAQYLRSGGSAPLKKAMEDEQRRLDRQGYWSPAPETPEFTEWQRQLAQSASDRWFDAMLKQGHSQAYAYAALVFAPAGVNPNEANFDNAMMIFGSAAVAAKGMRQLRPSPSRALSPRNVSPGIGRPIFFGDSRPANEFLSKDPPSPSPWKPGQADASPRDRGPASFGLRYAPPRNAEPESPLWDETHPLPEGVLDRPRTRAHTIMQDAVADDAQSSGRYQRISRGSIRLSEFSGLMHTPDIEPDFMGLTIAGRIDMIEIVSPGQTRRSLEKKLETAMKQLPPEMRGQDLVIDPKDAFK